MEFAATVESADRRKLVLSGLLTEGCVLGTALASYNPDIYEIPIGPFGHLGRAVTIPLNGPVATFSTGGLNLNGIAATADGNTLIVDNTVLDKLFTVNPVTGPSAPINVAGLIPNSMDGLLL